MSTETRPVTSTVTTVTLQPVGSLVKEKPIINVLVIGSSGDGKTTLIQMLKMCSIYRNLYHACETHVSDSRTRFTTTVGNNFNTVDVVVGNDPNDPNDSKENKDNVSVTQGAKSHTIITDDLIIKLIDTPGFNDTRGIQQDFENIKALINWVVAYEIKVHIILCVVSSNPTRGLVTFGDFVRCVKFLHESLKAKLMYAFTHVASTQYVPGDTGSLLSKHELFWTRDNAFCFDNEPFRYYMIQTHNKKSNVEQIPVDDLTITNAYKSWKMASKEWDLLLASLKKIAGLKHITSNSN